MYANYVLSYFRCNKTNEVRSSWYPPHNTHTNVSATLIKTMQIRTYLLMYTFINVEIPTNNNYYNRMCGAAITWHQLCRQQKKILKCTQKQKQPILVSLASLKSIFALENVKRHLGTQPLVTDQPVSS